MKDVLIFIGSWFLMGLFFALVGYVFSGFEYTYSQCLAHPGVWCCTVLFGWMPATYIVVSKSEKQHEQK